MIPFNKCPVCGGEVNEKTVEKIVRGGNHTAIIRVKTEVCTHCGERYYSKDSIKKFEQIRNKLKDQDFSEFQKIGQSFIAAG
ncbi:MAG: YgiT-type zinc finger protein [Calditrichaceae bacterium]